VPITSSVLIASAHGPFGDSVAAGPLADGSTQLRKRRRLAGKRHAICACKVFRNADTYFKAATAEAHRVWKAAVTRPGMSGYDLYMKEAMTLGHAGYSAPLFPSPSGGFSALHAVPMPTFYPHPCAQPAGGQVVTGTFGWLVRQQGHLLFVKYYHQLTDEYDPLDLLTVHVKANVGWSDITGDWLLKIDDDMQHADYREAWAGTIYEPLLTDPIGKLSLDSGTAAQDQAVVKDAVYAVPVPPFAPGLPWEAVRNVRDHILIKGHVVPLPIPYYEARLWYACSEHQLSSCRSRYHFDIELRITNHATHNQGPGLLLLRSLLVPPCNTYLLHTVRRPHTKSAWSFWLQGPPGLPRTLSYHLVWAGSVHHGTASPGSAKSWRVPADLDAH